MGFEFENHRQGIMGRIKLLSTVFSVDLCAYAIMSNHFHIEDKIEEDTPKLWPDFFRIWQLA